MPLDIRIRFGRAVLLIAGNSLLLETTLGRSIHYFRFARENEAARRRTLRVR
jgi:hypothetical protein